MKPILFEADSLDYSSNGIGVLHDVLRLEVEEERNGYYGFEMEYPVDGEWLNEIKDQRLILAKPNDVDEPHVFRIYNIDKSLSDGIVYVSAVSITDDLSGNLVLDGSVTDATAQQALNAIKANLIEPTPFDFVSDITTQSSSQWTRINPLLAMAGVRGSLVDLWGGEIKRTNSTMYLYSRRGKDKVTTIRPGKNIDGFNMTVSTKGLITRILPFFEYTFNGLTEYEMVRDPDGNLVKQESYSRFGNGSELTTVIGDIVTSSEANKYPLNRYEPIDLSNDEDLTDRVNRFVENKEREIEESPTIIDTSGFEAELKAYVKSIVDTKAAGYFTYINPGVDKPKVEVKVDILQLSDSPEWEKYEKLERIQLTDTVDIYVKKFDVDVEIAISAITYDSIGERVVNITAGSIQSSLSDSTRKEYEDMTSKLEDHMSTEVNGVKNIIDRTADGLNRKFTGYTEPSGDVSEEGDLWFKLIGEGQVEIYIYTGGKWDPVVSEAVFDSLVQDMDQAMQDVQDAKTQAEEAYGRAEVALTNANEAIADAQIAFDAAQSALDEVGNVDLKAEKALGDILEVETKADNALADAQESFNLSQQAMQNAGLADGKASQALLDSQEAFDKAVANADEIDGFGIRIGTNEDNYTTIAGTVGGLQTEVGKKVDNSTYTTKMTQLDNLISSKITEEDADGLYTKQSTFAQTVTSLQSEIGSKVGNTTYNSKMTQLDNAIGSMITESDAEGRYTKQSTFTQTVSGLQTDISKKVDTTIYNSKMTQLDGLISSKISVTDADGKYTAQSTFTQTVSSLQTSINGKVGTSTYNSKMTQLDSAISARITESVANGRYTTQTTFNQFSNSFSTRVEAIENWEIGVRNLIQNFNSNMLIVNGSVIGDYEAVINNSGSYINIYFYTQSSTIIGNPLEPETEYTLELYDGDPNLELGVFHNKGSNFIKNWTKDRRLKFNTTDRENIRIIVRATSPNQRVGKLSLYKGSNYKDWTPAPEDIDHQFSQVTQELGSITSEVSNKVNTTTYNTKMTQLDNAIAARITTASADGKYTTKTEFTATTGGIQTEVSKKVNTAVYAAKMTQLDSAVGARVTTTTYNSKMTQLDSAIQARVTQTTADGRYAYQSTFTQTVDSITSRIGTIETSTGNLVNNPEITGGHTGWSGNVTTVMTSFSGVGTRVLSQTQVSSGQTQSYSSWFDIDPSKTYEVSMWVRKSAASGIWYLGLNARNSSNTAIGIDRVSSTGVLTANDTNFYFVSGAAASTTWTKLTGYIMPSGTPASEMKGLGTDRNARFRSDIRQIRVRFLNWNNGTTARTMSVAMPKVVEVSTDAASQISQLNNAINLRVQKNDVVNQLNIDTSGILLQGKKISLDGDTTVLGTFRVANANITSLSGSKITTGTLNAANVNIINLNVNNLVGMTSTLIASLWNGRNSQVQINGNGLETYSNGIRTSVVDGNGHGFYRDNYSVGYIGTNKIVDTNRRGLTFNLDYGAEYMAWASKNSQNASVYTQNLTWYRTSATAGRRGFVFSDPVSVETDRTLYLRNLSTSGYSSGDRQLQIQNHTWDGADGVFIRRGSVGGGVFMNNTYVTLKDNNNAHLTVSRDSTGNYVKSTDVYNRTYTASTQMVRVTTNGVIGRSTSSRRYKLEEQKVSLEYAKRILDVDTVSWYDKRAIEEYTHTLNTGEETEENSIRRVIGNIAEDMHDAGLELLVNYDEYGRPDGIASNPWSLHTPLIKDLYLKYDEVSALRQANEFLVLKVANLEERINQMEVGAQ